MLHGSYSDVVYFFRVFILLCIKYSKKFYFAVY